MSIKNLRERVESLGNSLPFMEGREKADLSDLYDKNLTLIDYGFLNDENGDRYSCFIVKEDTSNFYFGGKVLTSDLEDLDADGYGDEIRKEGLPILLYHKEGKRFNYTAVKYYPQTKSKK